MRRPANSSIFAPAAALIAFGFAVLAQEPAAPPSPQFPSKDLPDEQVAAGLVSNHPLSLPAPPELLLLLAKESNPKWRNLYHPGLQGQEFDRTKTALRFGLSITEAHLANMARDAQRIRDVSTDLQRYAKVLGIGEDVAEIARDLAALVEATAWPSVGHELEVLVSQAGETLRAQRDPELAHLVMVGQWVRLLQVACSIVTQEDFADTSVAIGNHKLLAQIAAPIAASPDATVCSIRDQLGKIERLWNPEKLASGHRFDDALVQDTLQRFNLVISTFTR